MTLFDKFYDDLEKIFAIEKIKSDLYEHYGISESGIIEITSYSSSGDSEKKDIFSKNDSVAILAIRTLKRYKALSIPYLVEVAIGDYEINFGLEKFKKYKAEILYDDNFNILTIDYHH